MQSIVILGEEEVGAVRGHLCNGGAAVIEKEAKDTIR
jgi:hypothetical protein